MAVVTLFCRISPRVKEALEERARQERRHVNVTLDLLLKSVLDVKDDEAFLMAVDEKKRLQRAE
ncbi:MAG: hypothetical protein Unbinned4509contig1000_40 [Prokaryotic dsDNA virus sp.]|nr:MAG: hypothetical protein Unbinned4509contig1000_40 [Prokaryotic dsDNA virus sp.]|tara:strand:- start:31903 stop:32094 length:192 start_codon:yes stop_codon:yes gene_type:complete